MMSLGGQDHVVLGNVPSPAQTGEENGEDGEGQENVEIGKLR